LPPFKTIVWEEIAEEIAKTRKEERRKLPRGKMK